MSFFYGFFSLFWIFLGELQICHEDRKVNRNGSSGLVFGRVVSGLESLGHALKFQDHIDDPAFPLHELMPRVEFYFGEWEVLADWQPAAPGEDAGAPAVSEDDEKDFMDMSFQSVENSLADSVASLIWTSPDPIKRSTLHWNAWHGFFFFQLSDFDVYCLTV